MGRPEVQRFVEQSDCLLMLGTFLTDMNLGIWTAHLDRGRSIEATSECIHLRHHHYRGVLFADFMRGLLRARIRRRSFPIPTPPRPRAAPVRGARAHAPLTVTRLFERLNGLLQDNMVVISDVGVCLFGAADLVIHRGTEFLAPAYYTSMGFAVPAVLGAQMGRPGLRPVVLVGDGAFQMTGTELSTIGRLGLNPIILVLNNRGYTTERFILDGPFNDITDWRYENLPSLLGTGWGRSVRTAAEFEEAWRQALHYREGFSLLNLHLARLDCSPGLVRLGERLAARLRRKH